MGQLPAGVFPGTVIQGLEFRPAQIILARSVVGTRYPCVWRLRAETRTSRGAVGLSTFKRLGRGPRRRGTPTRGSVVCTRVLAGTRAASPMPSASQAPRKA